MNEILMTPEGAMQFMVWSYFYHDVMPEKNVSYAKVRHEPCPFSQVALDNMFAKEQ